MTFEPDITTFRPDRPGIQKVLGDLEAEIMEVIWARPIDQETLVRDVFEVLYPRRRLAYTTVMSTMARLAKKKYLRVEKKGQRYLYYPTCTRQEFVSRFVSHILENLFVSFSGETLKSFQSFQDPQATTQAHRLLDDIIQQRKQEDK
jgi:predicted transcriptional regulator